MLPSRPNILQPSSIAGCDARRLTKSAGACGPSFRGRVAGEVEPAAGVPRGDGGERRAMIVSSVSQKRPFMRHYRQCGVTATGEAKVVYRNLSQNQGLTS